MQDRKNPSLRDKEKITHQNQSNTKTSLSFVNNSSRMTSRTSDVAIPSWVKVRSDLYFVHFGTRLSQSNSSRRKRAFLEFFFIRFVDNSCVVIFLKEVSVIYFGYQVNQLEFAYLRSRGYGNVG